MAGGVDASVEMLRRMAEGGMAGDASLRRPTAIPTAIESAGDAGGPTRRADFLDGAFGEAFNCGMFRPSAELVELERQRVLSRMERDVYMERVRETEDMLCRACGVVRPEDQEGYLRNTMGNGSIVDGHQALVMGNTTDDPQHPKMWGISQKDRTFHMWCLGSTGSGKSTFLRSMIVQDMWYGRGGIVVEPHGDLSEELLEETPPYRLHDVVYMDVLRDLEHSPGFNPLYIQPEAWRLPDSATKDARSKAVTSVVSLIAKHFHMDQGAVQLKKNLENALNALVWCPGATIIEIMDFYNNPRLQEKVLSFMPDGVEKERIKSTAANTKPTDLASLDNRISAINNNMSMKRMFGQSRPTLNFFELMNSGYMIICPLNKGSTDDTSFQNFVGSYIISEVYHAAMKRESIPQDDRVIFPVTIDEFQNFAGDDVSGMLSECRKYGLPLVLANQFISQLKSKGEIGTAVQQCGTKMYLKMTDDDAAALASSLDGVTKTELMNLPRFHAIAQTIRNSQVTAPFMSRNINIDAVERSLRELPGQSRIVDAVKEISAHRFMRAAEDIDAEIDKRHEMLCDPSVTREDMLREFVYEDD